MLYEKMLAESTRLDKQLISLQTQLQSLPEGKLLCNENGNYHKYYQSKNGIHLYLKKEQLDLAKQLALKKYLTLLSEDLYNEKTAIDSYLKHYSSYSARVPALFEETSGFLKLLLSHFESSDTRSLEWLNTAYERNANYPQQLIHKSISGNVLRSKSEALIDMSLFLNKIPFRYECALHLEDMLFFPDFTIFQPETNTAMYWEHFGMMDNPTYAKNAFSKLQLYSSHGIIPTINLIATFETRENPLTSDEINRMIQHYLL
ncbi:MAG: ATPase [Lachnospiraceae bacterium]|nr:ATPase [Lachnospiraceae bacterium]